MGTAPAHTAAAVGEHPRARAGLRDGKWAANLEAARQFHTREGHLRVPREHVERLETVVVKLGTWLDNVRKRVAKLAEQWRADLDALGIPW
ncbi:helicase associated domain-containing protein [Streptomyces sp. NPDC014735]|uniref:helicase associated domain-containing protein n=1 Tax=unclassified Streptomyces TaxID=2593676 RepID=UPI0036FB810C